MSEKIIGIDLGTATTEAAIFTDGQVHMIPNPDQQNITPSAVGLDETGKITVGEQAKASYLLAPERTAIEVKRKIGTGEQIRLGKKTFTPAEISAEILKYVKAYASQHLGEEITREKRVQLVGPADASISKVNDFYRKVIYLKTRKYDTLVELKNVVEKHIRDNAFYKNVTVQYDFNPMSGF